MNKLFKKIHLYFNPPKNGDVFFGDPFDFLCDSNWERLHYPMSDRHGHDTWSFVPGTNTYRFTIESAAMPYYRCKAEILAANREEPFRKCWIERSQPRRIWKKDFLRLILEDRMVRTQSQSLYK